MTAKPFPISSSKTPEHAASPETRGPIRSSTIPARSGKTYRLFILHHQNARLLLHPPVHQRGAFIYDLGFRRDLITNKGLIEAIDLLYWDTKRHRPKRGATTPTRPGNLRRLIAVIQQLDFNYDLYGMRAHEILQLLPPEFDAWRPPPLLTRGGRGRAPIYQRVNRYLKWPERSKTERWRLAGWLGGVSPPTRQDSKQ